MAIIDLLQDDESVQIRNSIRKLCDSFPPEYWRKLDRENAYPTDFVKALSEAGYLSVLIPETYGGSGLKLSAAATVLEEIQKLAPMAPHAMPRCTSWALFCGMEAMSRSRNICPRLLLASSGFRLLE